MKARHASTIGFPVNRIRRSAILHAFGPLLVLGLGHVWVEGLGFWGLSDRRCKLSSGRFSVSSFDLVVAVARASVLGGQRRNYQVRAWTLRDLLEDSAIVNSRREKVRLI